MHFVTHEMRTPLSAIQGSSELISRFELTEEKRTQVAQLINSESKRLARMVEIFLNVERLSAGQMELKRESIPIKEMVEVCLDRVKPLAERKRIAVVVEPMLDNMQVTGDRELMEYACYNLLTNAVKYSPQRTEVRVSAWKESGHVRVSVKDQGIGMDQKEVKQIFQKFYRTKKAEESGEAGTGIGLSIVQQIVEQHGGEIEVVSQPGAGSCFTLTYCRPRFPRRIRQWRNGANDAKAIASGRRSGLQFTILTALEQKGYAVDAVSTTGEAIERLSDGGYPIVISDIYVDEGTGLDVLDAAKRKDPDCSVILMTGRGTIETVMAATRGGAFDYIAKPFDLDVMLDAIERAEASREVGEKEAEEEDLPETEMIGFSPPMVEIYKTVARVAGTDATVVIEGETGTGKELVARMIHRRSKRANAPFVAVDCASITPTLLESELFGAMRGAFHRSRQRPRWRV
jgi:FixJ family two-component response regulator/anti-sigma regulatory factor (Ser/Thr protein kinase)